MPGLAQRGDGLGRARNGPAGDLEDAVHVEEHGPHRGRVYARPIAVPPAVSYHGPAMARGRLAWLLSVPLISASGYAAHAFAHRLVVPGGMHHHMAAAGGMSHWVVCAAAGGIVALAVLGAGAVASFRTGRAAATPLWVFALLPPAGYLAQEQLGGVLGDGSGFGAALLLGLVLQVPLALGLYVLARALTHGAARLGRGGDFRTARLRAPRTFAFTAFAPPRLAPLALGFAERGPPAVRAF